MGPPPEIVQSIHAKKMKANQKHYWSSNNKLNSVGFTIDDFENLRIYNRSNELHREWRIRRSRDVSRTPRWSEGADYRLAPVLTMMIIKESWDSFWKSSTDKLQKSRNWISTQFTPSQNVFIWFSSRIFAWYGILCLSLNNFKETNNMAEDESTITTRFTIKWQLTLVMPIQPQPTMQWFALKNLGLATYF